VKFAAAWDDAVGEGTDLRGLAPGEVIQLCGHVRRYSDALLIFLLKARRPEKYSDKVGATHQRAGAIAAIRWNRPESRLWHLDHLPIIREPRRASHRVDWHEPGDGTKLTT